MGDSINKLIWFFANPGMVATVLLVATVFVVIRSSRGWKWWLGAVTLVWFYVWSTGPVLRLVWGDPAVDYPVLRAEDYPYADAIVLLGGGIGKRAIYPELYGGADRAWHAARLWKAGKAPIIIPSNIDAEQLDVKLLVDLGIPREAVVLENKARNTEENAKYIAELMKHREGSDDGRKPKILLATSVWHMKRSVLMFQKYAPGLEIIPAAADYEMCGSEIHWRDWIPSAGHFAANEILFHEWLGYWGYRLFR